MKLLGSLGVLSMVFIPALTNATPYNIDMDNSKIEFSGTHIGDEFKGVFEEWSSDVTFDKENLAQSSVTVTFNTASAKTGNAMYDGTLSAADWFDVKNHPQAVFKTNNITANNDEFTATGDLTIKDITNPIRFDFTLEGDSPTIMKASFPLNRLDYDIGKGSDATAEWVSQDIQITITLTASPAQ